MCESMWYNFRQRKYLRPRNGVLIFQHNLEKYVGYLAKLRLVKQTY